MLRQGEGEERRIVPFAAATRTRGRRPPDGASETRGAILFFTGVRYQRIADEVAPERSAAPDRRVGS